MREYHEYRPREGLRRMFAALMNLLNGLGGGFTDIISWED